MPALSDQYSAAAAQQTDVRLGASSAVALAAFEKDDVEQVELSLTERDVSPGRVDVEARRSSGSASASATVGEPARIAAPKKRQCSDEA